MIQTQRVLDALYSIRRSLDSYDPQKTPSVWQKVLLHPADATAIKEDYDVQDCRNMKGEPLEPNDPHGKRVEWGCTRKDGSGAICWRGEWAEGIYQPYWSTDLSRFLASPERVKLWGQIQFPYPIGDTDGDFPRPMGATPT